MNYITTDLKSVFAELPANYLLILPDKPDYTIVACSKQYALATGTDKIDITGKRLFDVFPDNPQDKEVVGVSKLSKSLSKVIATKKPDVMGLTHYDVPGGSGDFMEKFWNPVNIPVMDDKGDVSYIIHCVEDTTEKLRKIKGQEISKGIGEEQRRRFKNIILSAPLAVAILKGPLFIIDAINEKMCVHWGRPKEQLIDKPLYEALLESRTDEFEKMLRNIFITGERFTSKQGKVTLNRQGQTETVYVDFVCEPLFDMNDIVDSILVMAYETSVEI